MQASQGSHGNARGYLPNVVPRGFVAQGLDPSGSGRNLINPSSDSSEAPGTARNFNPIINNAADSQSVRGGSPFFVGAQRLPGQSLPQYEDHLLVSTNAVPFTSTITSEVT